MAVLPLVPYGSECLSCCAETVAEFDDELQAFIDDMVETMYAENGVGLAAPQVGVSRRVFVADPSADKNRPVAFVNPEIVGRGGFRRAEEGCLSIPGFFDQVDRAARVRVVAQRADGTAFGLDADGLFARIVQHEVEHLDGRLFVYHLSAARRRYVRCIYGRRA